MPGRALEWGARVYYYSDDVILVKQTRKSDPDPRARFTIYRDSNGNEHERHIDPDHDEEIVQAILDAGRGQL